MSSTHPQSPPSFADRLRDLRRSAGLTQEQAAVLCGVSRSLIARAETGLATKETTKAHLLRHLEAAALTALSTQSPLAKKTIHPSAGYSPLTQMSRGEGTTIVQLVESSPTGVRLSDLAMPTRFVPRQASPVLVAISPSRHLWVQSDAPLMDGALYALLLRGHLTEATVRVTASGYDLVRGDHVEHIHEDQWGNTVQLIGRVTSAWDWTQWG